MRRAFVGSIVVALLLLSLAVAGSTNGSGGLMPAYYDDELFTINFKQLPPGGESAVLSNNSSLNTIYMCVWFTWTANAHS